MVDEVRAAYERRDLEGLAALLADDVTWGEPGVPGSCHERRGVVATFRRQLDAGLAGEVVSVVGFPGGVVVHLRTTRGERWQALLVSAGRISKIRGSTRPHPPLTRRLHRLVVERPPRR